MGGDTVGCKEEILLSVSAKRVRGGRGGSYGMKGDRHGGVWSMIVLTLSLMGGCFDLDSTQNEAVGLAETIPGEGPRVIWETFPEGPGELPDAPFPNIAATRFDETSPTQRRLNISVVNVPTQFQRNIREQINFLDGFGTSAPIWVSFDQPIDLNTVYRNPHNAVVLMQLEDCERYPAGTVFPVDLGEGNYPTQLQTALRGEWHSILENDPYKRAQDILFNDEPDKNHDGQCDLVDEDLNMDGVCHFAGNRFDLENDGDLDYIDFYDLGTNTLIIRPVFPLDQQCEYGVFLTRNILGMNNYPIRSPFRYVNHTTQTEMLKKAVPHLQKLGIGVDDIAFAWAYNTGTITKLAEAIGQAPFGEGVFGYFEEEYPAEIVYLSDPQASEEFSGEGPSPYLMKSEPLAFLSGIIFTLWSSAAGSGEGKLSVSGGMTLAKLFEDYVDYVVWGAFRTPLLTSQPVDFPDLPSDEGVLLVDYRTGIDPRIGKAPQFGEENVPFFCSIPKARPELGIGPPFPVVLFGHGFASSRVKAWVVSGSFARFGIAVCGMDGPEHGPNDKIRIEEFLPFLCHSAKICGDEDVKALLDEMLRDSLSEVLGVEESESTTAELVETFLQEYDSEEVAGRWIRAFCGIGDIRPRDSESGNRLGKGLLRPFLFDFEKRCALSSSAMNTLMETMVATILENHDPERLEELIRRALDTAEDVALGFAKGLLIDQIVAFCPDVDKAREISLRTDITDLIAKLWSCPFFKDILTGDGRAKSTDLLGEVRSAGKFFDLTNIFHGWANQHQVILDYAQMVRMILGFTGTDSRGRPSALHGDFNEDGVVDLGGPFFVSGSSLGGIFANIVGATVPYITAAVPVSGGGIVTDIAIRTFQDPFWQVALGVALCSPCIGGRWDGDRYQIFQTFTDLTQDIYPDHYDPRKAALSHLEYISEGSRLPRGYALLKNLRNGDEEKVRINSEGEFRLAVATDVGDPLELTLLDAGGNIILQRQYASPVRGFGYERNTQEFRNLIFLAHHILDASFGVNYVNRYYDAEIPYHDATGFIRRTKRFDSINDDRGLFNVCTAGDDHVPISSCMYGRIYGAWDDAFNQELIRNGFLKGAAGPAFVNSSGKVCMRGAADCVTTFDNQGDVCPLDDEGDTTPCYPLVPWVPDPSIWNQAAGEPLAPPEGCSPVDPLNPEGSSLCTPFESHAPRLDGTIRVISEDPLAMPGPLEAFETGTRSDGGPVQSSAAFVFVDGIAGHHGLPLPDTKYVIPMPEGYPEIPSDVGTFLLNQIGYFFTTGKILFHPCLENDTCDEEFEDYIPARGRG